MRSLRYIHAADLHLDTPFRGLDRKTLKGEGLGKILHKATFSALERLTRLALSEKPDFVVLAGDIYNHEDYSVKAQLQLREACERLGDKGIRVFIAHGNHDPLSSRLASIKLPPNVTVFSPDSPDCHLVAKNDSPLALIHGISHAADREPRNLAALFKRDPDCDCFQLGVLHCTLDNAGPGRYAPCSVDDLLASGLDAWALGHVHERKVVSRQPFIAYSGNTQGLHINEPGARGCYIVDAAEGPGGWRCEERFVPLGSVEWETINVDVDGIDSLPGCEEKLTAALENLITESQPHVQGVVARVNLQGRTPLRKSLASPATQDALLESASVFENSRPALWIKDLQIDVADHTGIGELSARDDLLGETARLYREIVSSEDQLASIVEEAARPMFKSPKNRQLIPGLTQAEMSQALARAQRICQDILEGR